MPAGKGSRKVEGKKKVECNARRDELILLDFKAPLSKHGSGSDLA